MLKIASRHFFFGHPILLYRASSHSTDTLTSPAWQNRILPLTYPILFFRQWFAAAFLLSRVSHWGFAGLLWPWRPLIRRWLVPTRIASPVSLILPSLFFLLSYPVSLFSYSLFYILHRHPVGCSLILISCAHWSCRLFSTLLRHNPWFPGQRGGVLRVTPFTP